MEGKTVKRNISPEIRISTIPRTQKNDKSTIGIEKYPSEPVAIQMLDTLMMFLKRKMLPMKRYINAY